MDFFDIPLENVVVVYDDISLDVGKMRIRRNGSAGGHNGIKSIIALCGGQDFPRVKIGVGKKPHPDYNLADWVLSRFTDEEMKKLSDVKGSGRTGHQCDDSLEKNQRVGKIKMKYSISK